MAVAACLHQVNKPTVFFFLFCSVLKFSSFDITSIHSCFFVFRCRYGLTRVSPHGHLTPPTIVSFSIC